MRDRSWTNYVHVNEKKFGNSKPDTWGPNLQVVARALTGPRFVRFLERLTGIDDLLPDRAMDGGGLHQVPRGGFLNVHADFTAHHAVSELAAQGERLGLLQRALVPRLER